MKKEFYEEHYKNGQLMACMPVDLKRIAFILKDTPLGEKSTFEEMPTRIIVYVPDKNPIGIFGFAKWEHTVMGLQVSAHKDKWIVCDQNFQVDEIIDDTNWYSIPTNEKGHLAQGIVNIGGSVYAYGMVRSVFKRTSIKQWENITAQIKHPNLYKDVEASKENLVGDWVGFSALDGFNQDDLYAGGNRGDCWRYDGKKWLLVDLPINSDISSITCAPNDKVYIACRIGAVLCGRANSWEVIDKSKQINHSAWFNDQVYFASKNGRIYTHEEGGNELIEASFNTKYPSHIHHLIVGLASCEECLVIYTSIQAYAYDGQNWHEIIEIPSLSSHT